MEGKWFSIVCEHTGQTHAIYLTPQKARALAFELDLYAPPLSAPEPEIKKPKKGK